MPRFVGYLWIPGWKGKMPMYSFRCKTCGEHVVSHPSGFEENDLICPICAMKEQHDLTFNVTYKVKTTSVEGAT